MISWEGEDPIKRLKWTFRSCRSGTWGSEPDGEHDVICIRAADFDGQLGRFRPGERTLRSVDRATYQELRLLPGDIILEKSGGGEKQVVGRSALYTSSEASVCSNFLCRCRPAPGIEPAFLNYVMLGLYLMHGTFPHVKQSTGIQNLDLGSYLSTKVRIPPLETQQRISHYLDVKTALIDDLLKKKRALLERLAERRQALIAQTVTKGLDPRAPMKPSGIDWLGSIPAHWDAVPLRRMAREVATGRTPPSNVSTDCFTEGVINWYTPGDYTGEIELHGSTRKVTLQAMEDGVVPVFPEGTIYLVGIGATLGRVAVGTCVASANQQLNAILLGGNDNAYYLAYFLDAFREEVRVSSNANTLGILNQDKTKSLIVLRPPPREQKVIAEFLQKRDGSNRGAIEKVQRSVDLLLEYRAALVSSAVSGYLVGLRGLRSTTIQEV